MQGWLCGQRGRNGTWRTHELHLDYLGIGDLYSGKGGLGSVRGYWTDRSAVSANSWECWVCAWTSEVLSLPAQEEDGDSSMSMVWVSAVHHCYWRQPLARAACETGCVSVYPCVSRICAQLCSVLGLQRGQQQPCPPAWAEIPGPQAPGWTHQPCRSSAGPEQLEEKALLFTSLNRNQQTFSVVWNWISFTV